MTQLAVIDPTSPELNYVVVNGVTSPGLATLTGVRRPYKWEEQQLWGRGGAVTLFRGPAICHFTLTITLFRREHFALWALFCKALGPPTKLKPFVGQMAHPLLSAADIKAVGIESLGQPERQPNGRWIATIPCIEYRAPEPALVTPRGAIPAVVTKPIPPKTAADIALAEETAKFTAARGAAR